MSHDCITNSIIEKSEQIGPRRFKRIRICTICSSMWSTLETNKGMAPRCSQQAVKIDKIIDGVCETFNVERLTLLGVSRPRRLTLIRHIAMYLCYDSGYSFLKIGDVFNRHHSAVIHGCRHAEKAMQNDKAIKRLVTLAKFKFKVGEATS